MSRVLVRTPGALGLAMAPTRLAFAVGMLLPAIPYAATYVVDTGIDLALTACDPQQPDDCSLRGAIQNANGNPSPDRIEFAIPVSDTSYQAATDHWRITVGTSPLPAIDNAVEIDGYTQPGAIPNTTAAESGGLNTVLKVELTPGTASGQQQNGLEISPNFPFQAASTFRGLAINRFAQQIQLWGTSAHRIEGCFLGTTITGTAAAVSTSGGRGYGVVTYGAGGYLIGGTAPAARNLLSGLAGAIVLQRDNDGLTVQGNLIGTDRSGTAAIGQTSYAAIYTTSRFTNARIGGPQAGARNLISGNPIGAIALSTTGAGAYSGTRIEGNFIGTEISGLLPLPNGDTPGTPQPALSIGGNDACNITIEGNTIAYNRGAGVAVIGCRNVNAGRNRYAYNRGLPVDLALGSFADGLNPNDPADADSGSNRLQNTPVIDTVALTGGGATTALTFHVDSSITNAAYPLTVDVATGSGGQPQNLVASFTYTAAEAQSAKTVVLTTSALLGGALTLFATDADGNTSEITTDAIFNATLDF
ncbi:MAG: hypothetical protein JNN30_17975 [Rhodanobacteraceae bacterium]|nr:hypothetical protein [Rhodanobacteraceae bacterium]